MEPWQQEELRQLRMDRQAQKLPRCQCCGRPITTERYLDLSPFGLAARACESCTEDNMHAT